MRDNFYSLPKNLPAPQNDGACAHLEGRLLPSLSLRTTANRSIDLATITKSPTVLFFYPRTGRPDEPAPLGWDEIPGARGCTPQSCGYRDLYSEFQKLKVQVFGASTQSTEFQQELAARIHLPYEILSDEHFALTNALNLPTFTFESMRLLKRAAWFCDRGKIIKVFYPVFPPDKNAESVLQWIQTK
jgi:peroxiredoxin